MKQIFNILANGDHAEEQKTLSIRVGARHFNFAISSRNPDQLLRLVWYSAEEMDEPNLREIYSRHGELRGNYHKVLVSYDHPQSVFIPEALYKPNDAKLLLEIMHGGNGNDIIMEEPVNNWQIQNIYGVPREIKAWINQYFPKAGQWHDHTIGIKHINTTDFEGGLMIDFREHDFSVIVSKTNKLLMAQTFCYAMPSDVIYHLLKICSEFSFLQEQVRISIYGLIEKESALYRELYQYFLHVRFREPAWQIPLLEQEHYPAHFFTSLNDLALCAS